MRAPRHTRVTYSTLRRGRLIEAVGRVRRRQGRRSSPLHCRRVQCGACARGVYLACLAA